MGADGENLGESLIVRRSVRADVWAGVGPERWEGWVLRIRMNIAGAGVGGSVRIDGMLVYYLFLSGRLIYNPEPPWSCVCVGYDDSRVASAVGFVSIQPHRHHPSINSPPPLPPKN